MRTHAQATRHHPEIRRRSVRRTTLATLAGAVALAAFAPPASAALPCEDDARETRRADRIHAEAMSLLPQSGEAARVAGLLERAAELRTPCDVAAIEELRLAGRAWHSVGRVDRARQSMRRAAELAVWTGHVVAAAHAYLDEAALAAEQGDVPAARQALENADRLSVSPLLTADQRAGIRARIGSGGTVAGR